MFKSMKKIMALTLALSLVISLCMSTFVYAANPPSRIYFRTTKTDTSFYSYKFTDLGQKPALLADFKTKLTQHILGKTGEFYVTESITNKTVKMNPTLGYQASLTNTSTNPPDSYKDVVIENGKIKEITIVNPKVTSVTVSPATASVVKGNTQKFTSTVNGTDGTGVNGKIEFSKVVKWTVEGNKSKNTTIDATGLLKVAADESSVALTVKATSDYDKSKVGTANVTVTTNIVEDVVVESIDIKTAPDKVTYNYGEELDLTGLVVILNWSDSNTEEVAFNAFGSKGVTTDPENGTKLTTAITSVTIGHISSIVTTSQAITVAPPIEYDITVAATENGSVSTNSSKAISGDEVTIITTPDYGYRVYEITVTDGEGNEIAITESKFTMPASNVTVTVLFGINWSWRIDEGNPLAPLGKAMLLVTIEGVEDATNAANYSVTFPGESVTFKWNNSIKAYWGNLNVGMSNDYYEKGFSVIK